MKNNLQILYMFIFVFTIFSCKKNDNATNSNVTNYSFTYGSWSACINGVQIRNYTSNPSGGTPPSDSVSRMCSTPVNCTFNYSAWSSCINGVQTRTYSSSPSGCNGLPPSDSLTRNCSSNYSFTYSSWSACINGSETRTYISTPPGGTPPIDSLNRTCYNYFKITSVTLNAFPATDLTGSTWDINFTGTSDPDIYFNIDSAGTNLYNGSISYLNNLTQSSLPISWPALPSPQVINDLSATYSITLYDSDSPITSDDLMGQIPFIMNDHITGYPSSFQITNGTSTVTINGTWY